MEHKLNQISDAVKFIKDEIENLDIFFLKDLNESQIRGIICNYERYRAKEEAGIKINGVSSGSQEYRIKGLEKPPLLVIELQDENSVPIVKLNGEEVGAKLKVDFSWATKTDKKIGGFMYNVEHTVTKNGPGIKTIKYEHGEFVFEREF
ncbi:hypothetical protein [Halalkalibacterium halodurans]|uniref:hypothetical protein n=1 Tax=Halalkalibacterium halodurans TaxID=86665 RepID=UPI002E20757A|nr:hypothetical protein [Halalkalibacterium halodurans]